MKKLTSKFQRWLSASICLAAIPITFFLKSKLLSMGPDPDGKDILYVLEKIFTGSTVILATGILVCMYTYNSLIESYKESQRIPTPLLCTLSLFFVNIILTILGISWTANRLIGLKYTGGFEAFSSDLNWYRAAYLTGILYFCAGMFCFVYVQLTKITGYMGRRIGNKEE